MTPRGPFLLWLVAVVALAGAQTLRAQMITPLQVEAQNPIVDEWGTNLHGSATDSPTNRDLVQLLWASNSVIYPPSYDGTPNPENPVVEDGISSIGNMTAPSLHEPAVFNAPLLNPRPVDGTLFVRVFNAPTLEESSFYSDSQLLTINGNEVLFANVPATTSPIDPRDSDGDGLNNSWEKSIHSNPSLPDSDGDGAGDYSEFRAGTDLLDTNSVFLMAWVSADADGNAVVGWSSVPDKQYQVEYTADDLLANPVYTNVSDIVTATGTVTEVIVPGGFGNEGGQYRVRLAE